MKLGSLDVLPEFESAEARADYLNKSPRFINGRTSRVDLIKIAHRMTGEKCLKVCYDEIFAVFPNTEEEFGRIVLFEHNIQKIADFFLVPRAMLEYGKPPNPLLSANVKRGMVAKFDGTEHPIVVERVENSIVVFWYNNLTRLHADAWDKNVKDGGIIPF